MSPKMTIIIPMYNVERFLPRCLDSVLNQTFSDWSAILVDDGSPDNSGKIADKYAACDGRFVVVHKKNAGVSAARNTALDMADGKYIMFLDSDDCIHPQTMEILYALAERESADVVAFEYDRDAHSAPDASDFPPNETPESFKNKYDTKKIKYKYIKNLITKCTNHDKGPRSWYVQTGMATMRMYRRDLISDLRFDTKISVMEDTLFWSRVLLRRPSGVITRLPLYFYTVNATSALHGGGGQSVTELLFGFASVADEYRNDVTHSDARIWYRRFLWSVLSRIYRVAVKTTNRNEVQKITNAFKKLKSDGILDLAPGMHARRYRRRILRFVSKNS